MRQIPVDMIESTLDSNPTQHTSPYVSKSHSSTESCYTRGLYDLPDELILYLAQVLDPHTFRRFTLTCKRFYHCFLSQSTCLGFHIQNSDQICYPLPKLSKLPVSEPAVHVSPDGFLVQFTQSTPLAHLMTPVYDYTIRVESHDDGHTVEKLYGLRKQGDRNVFSRMPLGIQRRFCGGLSTPSRSSLSECMYFEAHILDAVSDFPMRIGLCDSNRDHLHPPGTTSGSIGYQSIDGYIALGNRYGELFQFAPPWKKGDVVGCGYCPLGAGGPSIFFTLNGEWIGEAPYHISGEPENYKSTWFACFASAGPATVRLNVGQLPFAFSLSPCHEAPFLIQRNTPSLSKDMNDAINPQSFNAWVFEPNILSHSSDPYFPPSVAKGYEVSFPDNGPLVSRSVQSKYPIYVPKLSCFFYFEVEILHAGENHNAFLSVGIASKPYSPFHHIGWDRNSIGFHSDDGRVFQNSHQTGHVISEPYGSVGSVVGCGFNPDDGTGFFTHDGKLKHNFQIEQKGLYYPSVGAIRNWRVRINVGQDPFSFSLANRPQNERSIYHSIYSIEE